MNKKIFFLAFVTFILFVHPPSIYAQDTSQDINTSYTEDFCRANDNENSDQSGREGERTFPLLRMNFDADFSLRNNNPGANFSVNTTLDAGWAIGRLSISEEMNFGSADSMLATDVTGYFHLLAIGISDFSYKRYLTGHETRVLGGFSYTKHVRDAFRVDVNLGLAYFDTSFSTRHATQFGFQIGTRIIVNYSRVHSELSISGYQNVKLDDAGVDLSGTRLSCSVDTSTIDCIVPPREDDPGSYSGVNIISWQHAGLLVEENLFINAYETRRWQAGPAFIFRYENLPAIGTRFWVLAGFRMVWLP